MRGRAGEAWDLYSTDPTARAQQGLLALERSAEPETPPVQGEVWSAWPLGLRELALPQTQAGDRHCPGCCPLCPTQGQGLGRLRQTFRGL